MESNYKERLEYFDSVLAAKDDSNKLIPIIDMRTFRDACFYGVPDEPALRSTAWKLLLGYLPPEKEKWTSTLKSQRIAYYNWVSEFLQGPEGEPPTVDHPLSDKRGSKWASYFEDNLVLEQIDKDVRRTLRDFAFFHSHVPINPLNPLSPRQQNQHKKTESNDGDIDPLSVSIPEKHELKNKRFSFGFKSRSSSLTKIKTDPLSTTESEDQQRPQSLARRLSNAFIKSTPANKRPKSIHEEPIYHFIPSRRTLFKRTRNSDTSPDIQDYHWEVIERILFIYAKLNPDVSYVQGMNELLAPIYYVFVKSNDLESQPHAEADTFVVFSCLMSDVHEHFVGSLELSSKTGVNATIDRLNQRLMWFDEELFQNLKQKDVKPQYYAFRWITVLYSQDWDLPDVIRLWDSLLADRGMSKNRFEFLLDFTVAMLVCVRQEILAGDFAENISILQNYPIGDIQIVFNCAYKIRKARLDAVKNIKDEEISDTILALSVGSTKVDKESFLDSIIGGSHSGPLENLLKKSTKESTVDTSAESTAKKRMSTGGISVKSLTEKIGFTSINSNQIRRTVSVQSASEEDKFKRDWSFANPLNEQKTKVTQSSSLLSKFTYLISSDPLTPYRELEEKPSYPGLQADPLTNNQNDDTQKYKSMGLS